MPPDSNLVNPLPQPQSRSWLRYLVWSAAGVVLLLLLILFGTFALLEAIAHRPSPVHTTLTPAEILLEDRNIKQSGLSLRNGSFLLEHPFSPPWTSHSLLVPSPWLHPPGVQRFFGPHSVRASLLLADLDVLESVMQRSYGGWDSAAARGWDWNRWFADWRSRLTAEGNRTISFEQAFAPVDDLKAFQRDNHTQIPLLYQSDLANDGSQSAILDGTPTSPCTEIRAGGRSYPIAGKDAGQQVRSAKLWRGNQEVSFGHYIALPASFGVPNAVRCGSVWIPLQPIGVRSRHLLPQVLREMTLRKQDKPRIERLGPGVVYARLPSFSWSNYDKISRSDWPRRQPDDRVLIVDLRNNEGGAWGYGLSVLKDWVYEDQMVPFEALGSELSASCLYAPLRWNQAIASTPSILPSQELFLQSLLDRMSKPSPPGCPRATEVRPARWTYLQRRFTPRQSDLRIIALVNARCGSDCELMTTELASLPQAVVAGVNTYGVSQFIQPGYFVLPNTGLLCRTALGRSDFYGDHRSVDGYGLDVDIVIPEIDTLTPDQFLKLGQNVMQM